MPNPTLYDVHINRPLTNMSTAYLQDQSVYVADKVFPIVPSLNRSDLYYQYKKEDFFRVEMQERAPGTESAGGGYRLGNKSFYCRVFALHNDVDDQTRANSDTVLKPDLDAVDYLTQQAMLKREVDWANAYFTTGLWATTITGGASASNIGSGTSQYWNLSTSTPIEDLRAAQKIIHKATAKKPKTLVLGASAWYALQDNADLIDRVKYSSNSNTNPAQVTTGMVAALLGLDNIYIMEAVYNTANENQTAVMTFVGDKAALLCYSAPAPGLKVISAGYTFSWTGFYGAGPLGNRIKKFRMEHLESDRVEIQIAYQYGLVASDLGCFFSGCVQ